MEYERRVVFFVDILGFRDSIHSQECKNIGEVLTFIQRFYEDEIKGVYAKAKEITFFSDSIIISFPISLSLEQDLFEAFNDLQLLLINLLSKGVFLRGAVSFGDLYHDKTLMFGPAFLEAYDCETKNAIFPRIICGPSILEDIGSGEELLQDLDEVFRNLLTIDDDGAVFVDYFGKAASILSEKERDQYLKRSQEFTDRNLKRAKERRDYNVFAKFQWVKAHIERDILQK